MDQLLKMGSVYLSVKADGRVFAAIQTDDLLFDAGKSRPEACPSALCTSSVCSRTCWTR